MTLTEFNTWLESRDPSGRTHYAALIDHTRREFRRTYAESQELVHGAVASLLAGDALASRDVSFAWPYTVERIRGEVSNGARKDVRARKAQKELSRLVTGERGTHKQAARGTDEYPLSEDQIRMPRGDAPAQVGERGEYSGTELLLAFDGKLYTVESGTLYMTR